MTYNIHPLIVHFPIALLFLYSVVKIIPFQNFFKGVSWKHIERFLLIFGFLGALAALYTGDIAEHIIKLDRQLVQMHSNFAMVSVFIYGALLFMELIAIFTPRYGKASDGLFSKFLALIGLISISVTGLLGGVMMYGVSADPLAPMVLKFLGIHL